MEDKQFHIQTEEKQSHIQTKDKQSHIQVEDKHSHIEIEDNQRETTKSKHSLSGKLVVPMFHISC